MSTASSIAIAPRGATWAGVPIYSDDGTDFGHTRHAFWWRLRTQREHGLRHEPLGYALKLNFYDDAGRLWQHGGLAVVDDFGTLVEVSHG